MDYREGTIIRIITNTNNRLTCYAKKVCIHLTNSMYAYLIYLPLFLYQSSALEIVFFLFVKVS